VLVVMLVMNPEVEEDKLATRAAAEELLKRVVLPAGRAEDEEAMLC